MTSKLWKSHLFWYAAETSRLLRPKGAYVFMVPVHSSCLKGFTVSACLLLWSPIHKSGYGHSADNVRENVPVYALGLTVFVLSENYDICFYSYWFQHILSWYYHYIAFDKPYILSNILFFNSRYFRIKVKFFIYLMNSVWKFTFKSTCIFHVIA